MDPIITPVNIQQQQLMSTLTFMSMLQDIAPGAKSTCGLSNISNGPPDHLRPILNQTYMIMLERHGMYSCIVDGFDDKILDIARGNRPDIVEMVHKVMDGGERRHGQSVQRDAGLCQNRQGHPGPNPLFRFLAGNLTINHKIEILQGHPFV